MPKFDDNTKACAVHNEATYKLRKIYKEGAYASRDALYYMQPHPPFDMGITQGIRDEVQRRD